MLPADTVRRPLLTVSKDLYAPGDELEANCTSPPSADPELLPPPPGPVPRPRGHRRYPPGGAVERPLLPLAPPLQPHQLTPEQRDHLQKDAGQAAMSFGFWVNNRPVSPSSLHLLAPELAPPSGTSPVDLCPIGWRPDRISQSKTAPAACPQVPASLILQGASSAMMIRPVTDSDFSASGELRIKCVVTLADKYREPSHVVTVRRQDAVEETPVVATDASVVNAVDVPEAADRSSHAGRCCSSSSLPVMTNRNDRNVYERGR